MDHRDRQLWIRLDDWREKGRDDQFFRSDEPRERCGDRERGRYQGPGYSPYFYFEDEDKEHAVWFLDAVTFLNQLREVRDKKAGGFALYRLGSEDPAIWDALNVPRDFKLDNQTRRHWN